SDVLRMGTAGGAHVLRADTEIGTLAVDKRADIVILDSGSLAPGGDAATRILFGGGSRAVRDVIVDGQVLVRNGALLRMDAESVRFAATEALPSLISRAGLR